MAHADTACGFGLSHVDRLDPEPEDAAHRDHRVGPGPQPGARCTQDEAIADRDDQVFRQARAEEDVADPEVEAAVDHGAGQGGDLVGLLGLDPRHQHRHRLGAACQRRVAEHLGHDHADPGHSPDNLDRSAIRPDHRDLVVPWLDGE